jgi:hypothetical protein
MVPTNNFWFVKESGKLFSSFTGEYVPETDPAYLAWLETGSLPTEIPDEEALQKVLNAFV